MADRDLLKILTYNCNGLNNKIKAKRIQSALLKSRAEIVFLQETHLKKVLDPLLKTKRFGTQAQAPGTSKSRGVAILISPRLRPQILAQMVDLQGRFLFLNVLLEDQPYTLASVYVPNEKQIQYIDDVFYKLQTFSTGPIILGGDLNCVVDRNLDYSGMRGAGKIPIDPPAANLGLRRLLQKYDFCDAWRLRTPGVRDYTHHSQQFASHSKIDYLLLSNSLLSTLSASDIGLCIWSDHAWVEGQLQLHKTPKSRPHWRLNPNLIYLEPIHSEVEEEIRSYFKNNRDCGTSTRFVWDALKAVIRGKFIAASSSYCKQKRKVKDELLKSIASLEKQHKTSCSKSVFKTLQAERKKLEALEINKIQENILYLKQKYWLRSPKALKLLAWKVRTKRSQNIIHSIKNRSGQQLTSTPDILETFREFYASLYSSSNPRTSDILDYLEEVFPQKKLSLDHVHQLDAPITPEEVAITIKKLKNNKAPGPDGYGGEFYKVYKDLLIQPLAELFNNILAGEELPPSWSSASIVVLPKAGRDVLDPKSYRPISLLNSDYKIFTAVLTRRLNNIIRHYIHPD